MIDNSTTVSMGTNSQNQLAALSDVCSIILLRSSQQLKFQGINNNFPVH